MKNSLESQGMVLFRLILYTNTQVFSNIFRFTDNLDTLNNNEFEDNYSNIYPAELEFKRENENPWTPTFF